MDLGLSGRTAIVCGASSGIGLAIAESLSTEGANVAMFARRRELLEREAERLGALPVRGDLTNPKDLKRLVDTTVEAFGGIDVLVNNGGGPPRTAAVTLTDEDGNRVERVIPKGEFRTRLALFNFDADSSDARARLLAYGLPDAIGVDLLQDLFIDVREPPSFRRRLVEAGYPQLVGVPLALARDIAAEQFRDVFATGRVRTEGDEVVATVTVYRTATGAQLRALTVRGILRRS